MGTACSAPWIGRRVTGLDDRSRGLDDGALLARRQAAGERDGSSSDPPLTLSGELLGEVTDPWGARRSRSRPPGHRREDWALTWNMVLDAGVLLVSTQIRLEIEVELVRG